MHPAPQLELSLQAPQLRSQSQSTWDCERPSAGDPSGSMLQPAKTATDARAMEKKRLCGRHVDMGTCLSRWCTPECKPEALPERGSPGSMQVQIGQADCGMAGDLAGGPR